MIKTLFSSCFFLIHFLIPAQENHFKYYVDTLTSPSFLGRGYVNDGHLKAANYIAKEFENLGIAPINGSYFQSFPIMVNSFPKECVLKLCDTFLKPGHDFIVNPASGTSKGNFTIVPFQIGDSINDMHSNGSVFYLDVSAVENVDSMSFYNQLKFKLANIAPVIWYSKEKLTWSVSNQQYTYPIIQTNKNLNGCNEVFIDVENEFNASLETQNIIGKIKGRRKKILAVTAHYDHLGMMGSILYPGANDNASGVSLLLKLAQHYRNQKNKFSMVFICFGAEEIGLLGSKYFTENPVFDLHGIKFLINLDLVGTGEEGLAIVNAKNQKKHVKWMIRINKKRKLFKKIKLRGQAPNSDHYWFGHHDVPAVFLYTLGGVSHYHDPLDRSETLMMTKTEQLMDLIINFFENF